MPPQIMDTNAGVEEEVPASSGDGGSQSIKRVGSMGNFSVGLGNSAKDAREYQVRKSTLIGYVPTKGNKHNLKKN